MVKGGTLGDDIGYGQFSKEYILLQKLLRLKVYSCSFTCSCSIYFGTRGHELNFVFSPGRKIFVGGLSHETTQGMLLMSLLNSNSTLGSINLCENISINICWSLLKFGISHRPKNLDRGIVFFIYLLLDRIFLASSAPVAGVGIALALICQRLIEVFPLFLQF